MAFYDSAFYDGTARYDEVAPATQRSKMIQLKLELQSKDDAGLRQYSANHISKMNGNAAFPTPVPSTANFQTIHDAFSAALTASDNAQTAAAQATIAKDAARAALEAALSHRAKNIEGTPGVTEAQAVGTGFALRAPNAPVGAPGKVQHLALTTGDMDGELDAMWNRDKAAKTYDLEISVDPFTPTSWQSRGSVTKSKAAITGLTSGAKMWVRIRAVGTGGTGEWSDPAVKIVP